MRWSDNLKFKTWDEVVEEIGHYGEYDYGTTDEPFPTGTYDSDDSDIDSVTYDSPIFEYYLPGRNEYQSGGTLPALWRRLYASRQK
jgi:hypothetical protein